MAAKIAFVFICAFVIFQSLDAVSAKQTRSIQEDYEKATEPIHVAFDSVKKQVYNLVDKIQAHPFYKSATKSVNEGYEKAKDSITQTYDRLQACKKIIEAPNHA